LTPKLEGRVRSFGELRPPSTIKEKPFMVGLPNLAFDRSSAHGGRADDAPAANDLKALTFRLVTAGRVEPTIGLGAL
jgi:hypothetical protein